MSDDNTVIQQLIQQATRGDEQAIATIYQTYVDRIYAYVVYRVGSGADAEDLAAEVFVNMVERLPKYKTTGAPFEAWLYRIAAARVADYYRQKGRRPEAELPDNLAGANSLPEEHILEQQQIAELHAALSQLSEDEQQVLILRFVERKSHRAVATILNKRESAVKAMQHRALDRLAALLGSEKKSRHYLRGDDD